MSQDYNENRKRLGDLIKKEPIKTPIQEVRPVEQPPQPEAKVPNQKRVNNSSETHVNFWGPSDLVRRLKHYSVESGKSIKQIIIEGLESVLPPMR